ncbi:MAG: MarR family transcriptional regulator [Ancrocorticia sp.]
MAVKKSPTIRKSSVDSFAGLTAGLANLTPSQRSMLFVLSDLGEPATIQMLSERTGLHANSVRETLSVLMEAGLVRRSQVPSASRGRPAWEYETSVPADISAVMKEFTGFANSVCQYLRSTTDDPIAHAHSIGCFWGEELVSDLGDHGGRHEDEILGMKDTEALRHPIAKLRILFSILGFGAVAGNDERSISLTVCPFSRDGRAPDPLICHMHSGMLSSMLKKLTANHIDADLYVGYPQEPCIVALQPHHLNDLDGRAEIHPHGHSACVVSE